MGQSNQKLQVVTLNYSSIFLNPFEFYAQDNWQELQAIGIILEGNIRNNFQAIKRQITSNANQSFYDRKTFNWNIDKLDKIERSPKTRYSPLFQKTEEELSGKELHRDHPHHKHLYPGITQDGLLMDQAEYFKKWDDLFKGSPNKYSQEEMSSCRRLDFQCYRAIAEYLYNLPQNIDKLDPKIRSGYERQRFLKLSEIVDIIKHIQEEDKRKELIYIYSSYMKFYFSRIDAPTKVDLTMKYLFDKNEFDIICLQQANQMIIQRIRQESKYYVFAPPSVKEEDDQCIIIVNKGCKLIPQYYHQHHQLQSQYVKHVVQQISLDRLKDKLIDLKEWQSQVIKAVQEHFNDKTVQIIKKSIQQVKRSQELKAASKIRDIVISFLLNPLKPTFLPWLEPYMADFQNAYKREEAVSQNKKKDEKQQKKQKQSKEINGTVADLKENSLFYDNQSYTITAFTPTNRRLKLQQKAHDPLVIISLHLSSKEAKNMIQVQLLGILMYELVKHKYKFIMCGDFNSFVDVKDRKDQNVKGPFIYLKQFFNKQVKQKKQELQALQALKTIEQIQGQKIINVYPKHPMIYTTKKKRTILQVQVRKTNTLATKCIDQIITNLPVLHDQCYTGQIKYLGSHENKNKSFLPNRDHPYDHFAVQAIISTGPPEPQEKIKQQ